MFSQVKTIDRSILLAVVILVLSLPIIITMELSEILTTKTTVRTPTHTAPIQKSGPVFRNGNWRLDNLKDGTTFWWHDPEKEIWRKYTFRKEPLYFEGDPIPHLQNTREGWLVLYDGGDTAGMFVLEQHDTEYFLLSTEELRTTPP
ncbi:hypothetical protein HY407_00210 [Candidatus Gottesmanbacteria bacterium]|nr:hypothetical protein [Candidatus Gottesmanbacteria bacterium]